MRAPDDMTGVDDRHVSPWTTREKVGRLLWSWVQCTIFRFSPRPAYRWRNFLLRRFGATIAPKARLRPSVKIEVPWNITIGNNSTIGDHVILYALGPITIGERVTISQHAHLCAGTHDFTRPDFPLLRPPIEIEDDCWIATDAFVGPSVCIGAATIVGARASVFADLPPNKVCVGNPAKPIRDRVPNETDPDE